MEKPTPLSPELRENLVAYLDGELDEETVEALEATLANSAEAREEVDMLTRTWSLMDKLPQPGPSQEFTLRTLTAIQMEAIPSQVTHRFTWYRHARRGTIVACLAMLLGIGAFFGYHTAHSFLFFPEENVSVIQELDVIENLDNYSDVKDIEFLEELNKQKVFDEDPDTKTQ
jgi:hypothetical protein